MNSSSAYNIESWNEYNKNGSMQWQQFNYDSNYGQQETSSSQVPPTNVTYPNNYYYAQYQTNRTYPSAPFDEAQYNDSDFDFDTEPPLLEELGINFSHIKEKTLAVLNPAETTSADVIEDQDLAGPLVFCLLMGFALLFQGKLSFGEIYGIAIFGCTGFYGLLNAMSANKSITFCCTASILGYCLLPMAIISFIITALASKVLIAYFLASFAVLWSTFSSSKLIVTALDLGNRYSLVAYPCFLIYSMFALLAIF